MRIAPNKKVDHAIAALRCLVEENKVKAELKIVGEGREMESLKILAAEQGMETHIEFAGALDETEKDAALREAHWLLHTSVREGWGLNVIEANAMGTPAAVYPVPGLRESTLHEKTGLVAQQESPKALADVIASSLKCPKDYVNWRTAARDRAREFHWDHVLPTACDQLETWAKE